MSIFRKASELNNMPQAVSNALFEDNSIEVHDEFGDLIKEASNLNNKSIYEARIEKFKKASVNSHEYSAPMPAKYSELPGGIRRVGYGQRFADENSETFGAEKIRSINYDNNRYAENLLENGFSIWEPEFDSLKDSFKESQDAADAIFDRRTAAEKKSMAHKSWEETNKNQIRKSNVLPYRGLGITRLANEQPIHHGNINSYSEFYADAQDSLRQMTRESNSDRRTQITRKGCDPAERRSEWENKEAIAARTMESLNNSSFLANFAEGISLND